MQMPTIREFNKFIKGGDGSLNKVNKKKKIQQHIIYERISNKSTSKT